MASKADLEAYQDMINTLAGFIENVGNDVQSMITCVETLKDTMGEDDPLAVNTEKGFYESQKKYAEAVQIAQQLKADLEDEAREIELVLEKSDSMGYSR